ncbi:MAG: spore maturation protein [Clostridiales bacterium]|nr:spore maturation protein [Clostridiales bacterium]
MTAYILPCLIVLVVVYALIKRVNVFTAFIEGAGEALPMIKTILPVLATLMIALQCFRDSGTMDYFVHLLTPVSRALGFEAELLPVILIRPLSGSAAMAAAADLFQTHGVDSKIGFLASIIVGGTETVFYTAALYFGAAGVKRTRGAIPLALLLTVVAIVAGIWLGGLFYRP